jgi:hypothetical protein
MSADGETAVWGDLTLHLCGGTSNTTVVHGVQFWIDLEGAPLDGVASKGSVALFNNGTGVGDFSLLPYPLSTGQYQLIRGTFTDSGPATDITIGILAPGYSWNGTFYIDDLSIF